MQKVTLVHAESIAVNRYFRTENIIAIPSGRVGILNDDRTSR